MKVKKQHLLADYFVDFCKRRRHIYSDHWTKTWIHRIFKSDKAAKRLVVAELQFHGVETRSLQCFCKQEKISKEDLEVYRHSLANYIDENASRVSFLISFGALLLLSFNTLFAYPGVKEIPSAVFYVLLIFDVYLLAFLLERASNLERSACASQLRHIIDSIREG